MKDAYYFSHDSNAKDDPKCVLLIEQLGMEGYGIFWVLIETLREQPGYKYPLVLIPALARRYNTTAEKVKTVVMQYGFFEVENDEFFFSPSLNRRMEKLEQTRELRRLAGKKSAEKRLVTNTCSTNAEQMLNECSTSKVKKSKGKDNKENIPPISPKGIDVRFKSFWKAYPKKVGKGAAEKSFKKYKPDDALLEQMLTAIESQKKSDQWKKDAGQFIPNPSTWLNQKRWLDEGCEKKSVEYTPMGGDFQW